MISRRHRMLAVMAMGLCVVGLSGLSSQKNPVARPYKDRAQFKTVINMVHLSLETWAVGHTTHLGKTELHAVAQLASLDPLVSLWLTGTITAADGDQCFFEMAPDGSSTITGGTGRFEGASGIFGGSSGMQGLEVVFDPPFMIMTYTAEVEGTIIY